MLGAAMSAGPVIIYYSELRFHWGTFESSIFISSLSFSRVLLLMGLFPLVNYLCRIRPAKRLAARTGNRAPERNGGSDNLDVWTIRLALASDMVGALGYLAAPSATLFFASGMVTATGGLGTAAIQTSLSKHVPSEQVGAVLGAVGLLQASSRVVGPLVFNGLYYATLETFPRAIFVLLASFFALGLTISMFIKPRGKSSRQQVVVVADL